MTDKFKTGCTGPGILGECPCGWCAGKRLNEPQLDLSKLTNPAPKPTSEKPLRPPVRQFMPWINSPRYKIQSLEKELTAYKTAVEEAIKGLLKSFHKGYREDIDEIVTKLEGLKND